MEKQIPSDVAPDTSATEIQQQPLVPRDDKDEILALIVAGVDKSPDAEVSITICVPGGLVTGMLVSAHRFFELLATQVKGAQAASDNPEGKGNGVEFLQEAANVYASRASEPQSESRLPTYIHLRSARVLSGGKPFPSMGSTLWRGRLSHVSGFCIGMLTFAEADDDLEEEN